jgi:hypothetical protein
MKTTKIAVGAATALFLALLMLYLLVSKEHFYYGTLGTTRGPPKTWAEGATYTMDGKTVKIRQLTFTGIRDVIEVEQDHTLQRYIWVPDDQTGLSGHIITDPIVPIKKTDYGIRFGDAMLIKL